MQKSSIFKCFQEKNQSKAFYTEARNTLFYMGAYDQNFTENNQFQDTSGQMNKFSSKTVI